MSNRNSMMDWASKPSPIGTLGGWLLFALAMIYAGWTFAALSWYALVLTVIFIPLAFVVDRRLSAHRNRQD